MHFNSWIMNYQQCTGRKRKQKIEVFYEELKAWLRGCFSEGGTKCLKGALKYTQ